ncbi:splicing factor, suppressor of white-apricot homolog isoform X2 [Dendronephthya gigantea]|uniref:splicing factor, suppressor of white-apricot homolog isoform X2 n=1 Tax=Dendronephthya gigantea TaxID=151771 RepID=UPI00106B0BA7|nr:splicing factor, suppressor of white-apricot homolog isoform X2 [Dendronephthya gigantea]
MSVLFKSQFDYELEEKSREQHVQRRVGQKDKRGQRAIKDQDLLVFGYSCNVYCDDIKAVYFDEGRHLIPWMGDESLMIDRFDGRLLLEDISPFISKGSSDHDSNWQLSKDEQAIERLCDEERYQALENAEDSDDGEEEMKRFKAAIASESGSYSAVGMTYNEQNTEPYYQQYNYDLPQTYGQYYSTYAEEQGVTGPVPSIQEQPSIMSLQPQQQMQQPQLQQQQFTEHNPVQEVVEVFVPPAALDIPADMEVPDTEKLHVIIEKTAFFIKDHGPQMEIVVKAKQSGNTQFDFLQFDHRLNPYYKLILKAVRSGNYKPAKPATPPAEEEEEESEDSDGEMELHPLLTASLRKPITSNKKTDIPPLEPPPLPPGWTAVNPDATPGGNSFADKADNFLADMNMQDQTTNYPPGFPGYPYAHHGIPRSSPPPPGVGSLNASQQFPHASMYYQNNLNYPATSLPSYPGTDMAGSPIIPPPPDLKPICDKLAEYVARNGKHFEENIRTKNDPRFDFINETSDHYTYYQTRIREFELNPVESGNKGSDNIKSGVLVPSSKPVSFQIKKTKDQNKPVMEYRSNILYKTAKADESEEEGIEEDNTDNQGDKGAAPRSEHEVPEENFQGPKTQEDVMAEERAMKLKQEKEKEVQRLEEEVKSTTSSLRRQVQLERRRRAQLFINMLKKAKPGAPEQSSDIQPGADVSDPHGPS